MLGAKGSPKRRSTLRLSDHAAVAMLRSFAVNTSAFVNTSSVVCVSAVVCTAFCGARVHDLLRDSLHRGPTVHRGALDIESGPGAGTIVTVTLPAAITEIASDVTRKYLSNFGG